MRRGTYLFLLGALMLMQRARCPVTHGQHGQQTSVANRTLIGAALPLPLLLDRQADGRRRPGSFCSCRHAASTWAAVGAWGVASPCLVVVVVERRQKPGACWVYAAACYCVISGRSLGLDAPLIVGGPLSCHAGTSDPAKSFGPMGFIGLKTF